MSKAEFVKLLRGRADDKERTKRTAGSRVGEQAMELVALEFRALADELERSK